MAQENTLDRNNHIAMREAMKNVMASYANALGAVADKKLHNGTLSPELAEQMKSQPLGDDQVMWRTWAYGADADGRDQSTSIVLWDGIFHQVKNGEADYKSRRRDPRENAADQKECLSALVQRAYNTEGEFKQAFRTHCDAFVAQSHARNEQSRDTFETPKKSTLLQLPPDEQAKFIRSVLTSDYGDQAESLKDFHLVPASLGQETVAFNTMFYDEYRTFIRDARGLQNDSPVPDLNSLTPAEKQALAERINTKLVECNGQKNRFTFDPESMLYYPTEGRNKGFFEKARLTSKDRALGEAVTPQQRRKLLDVVKRLQVFNHAIGRFGAKVADRYQIANFESAADFYATLLLFKETGILEVNHGKITQTKDTATGAITSPKLSLQPLLETEEDQKRAPQLFSELLDDPLVLSYYQALGNRAEIMVGYSDGAKSAGNMASEWSIYKCTRELKNVFAKKGINVSFFHGRGRGDSRGGQFDEGQNFRASPPELQRDMHYDATHQSDGPMNGAISKAWGEDTLTSIITGVLTAKQEAELALKTPDTSLQMQTIETIFDTLTQHSGEHYRRLVANNPNTDNLLNAVHDNGYKSSRAATRGKKDFASQRAISVEYGFNMADAPLHYVGMHTALRTMMHDGTSVLDEDGHAVNGVLALEALYRQHPFFHNFIDKTAHGLSDYNPEIFRSYAKVAGVSPWAEECIGDLDGLRELAASISAQEASKAAIISARTSARALPEGSKERHALRNYPRPLAGRLPLREVVRRRNAGDRLDARAYNALRNDDIALDTAAHTLALSECTTNDELQSIDALGHNPMTHERDAVGDALNPQKAELLRNLSFVVSESNRNRGKNAPAEITAAVEHQPYLAR